MADVARDGAKPAATIEAMIEQLAPPRTVWVMLPAGEATETAIAQLADLLAAGDAVIDGGNTFWRDDLRRAASLKQRGLNHVDVGTSGGVLGRESGYCLMIGGEKEIVRRLEPIFAALAPGGDAQGRAGGERLAACRAAWRRPFRQDGAQRHRVRADAGLCRRLPNPERNRRRRFARGRTL